MPTADRRFFVGMIVITGVLLPVCLGTGLYEALCAKVDTALSISVTILVGVLMVIALGVGQWLVRRHILLPMEQARWGVSPALLKTWANDPLAEGRLRLWYPEYACYVDHYVQRPQTRMPKVVPTPALIERAWRDTHASAAYACMVTPPMANGTEGGGGVMSVPA